MGLTVFNQFPQLTRLPACFPAMSREPFQEDRVARRTFAGLCVEGSRDSFVFRWRPGAAQDWECRLVIFVCKWLIGHAAKLLSEDELDKTKVALYFCQGDMV